MIRFCPRIVSDMRTISRRCHNLPLRFKKQLWEFPKIPLEIIERHLLVFLGLADI